MKPLFCLLTALPVLARTPDLPNATYLASPHLTTDQRATLRDYLSTRDGFVAARRSDYDRVRELSMKHPVPRGLR